MLGECWWSRLSRWSHGLVALGCVLVGARAQGQASAVTTEVKLHEVPVSVTASSVLADAKNPDRYSPAHLLDEEPGTIWAEGAKGSGVGEWVELGFPPGTPVYGFLVTPGNPKSEKLYRANARPRKARLELKLEEGLQLDYELEFPRNLPAGGAIYVAYRRKWAVLSARLTVLSVWPGSKYRDLCLGTFVPVFRGPDEDSVKTFLGTGKELAPTLAAFLYRPDAAYNFLPSDESGESTWLRAYSRVPHNGSLPSPELEIDVKTRALSEWGHQRRVLAWDVTGARVRSDLFRVTPIPHEAGYVLDPIGPIKKPDETSNFRVRWRFVDNGWRVVGIDLKFREQTPD